MEMWRQAEEMFAIHVELYSFTADVLLLYRLLQV